MRERLPQKDCVCECRCEALQAALQRLLDAEDERRRAEREYERAVIAARGALSSREGNLSDG